jgi:WD40 repeat protein
LRYWNAIEGTFTTAKEDCHVHGIVYSLDGKLTAFAGGSLIVWDGEAGEGRFALKWHTAPTTSVAFNPNGSILASGSLGKTVRLWDTGTGQCLRTLGHTDQVYSVSFSADGSILASGSHDGTVKLWKTSTGEVLETLTVHGEVRSVVFGPDGRIFASAGEDKTVKVWDLFAEPDAVSDTAGRTTPAAAPREPKLAGKLDVKLRLTLRDHTSEVYGVEFSPDGSLLASCGNDNSLRIWNAENGELTQVFPNQGYEGLAFSPNGPILAASCRTGRINIWDIRKGKVRLALEGHTWNPRSLAFSPDGRTLASGSLDGTLRFWDAGTGRMKEVIEGYGDIVAYVAFSRDGKHVAFAAGQEGGLYVMNAETRKIQLTLKGHTGRVGPIAFNPDGSTLASTARDGLRFWDSRTGELLETWEPVPYFAFAPNGSIIADRSGGKVCFRNVATGGILASIDAHEGYGPVRFSPDCRTVATAGADTLIKLWDVQYP